MDELPLPTTTTSGVVRLRDDIRLVQLIEESQDLIREAVNMFLNTSMYKLDQESELNQESELKPESGLDPRPEINQGPELNQEPGLGTSNVSHWWSFGTGDSVVHSPGRSLVVCSALAVISIITVTCLTRMCR
jgi:hypothetical protein